MNDGTPRATLVGNRWMLAGGILYLLEFVAIIGASMVGVGEISILGASPAELREAYAGHQDAVALMAGWFSVCLLGRVLLFVGLRSALSASGRPHLLMDFAVVAAAVSVTLEVTQAGMLAAAADLADQEAATAMLILDQGGAWVGTLIYGGIGVAVLASSWCMRRSGLFSTPLVVLGLVAGVGVIATQLTSAPSTMTLSETLSFAAMLFWVWMLWAGVVLWRRAPRAVEARTALVPPR